jgi:hypothetical protein
MNLISIPDYTSKVMLRPLTSVLVTLKEGSYTGLVDHVGLTYDINSATYDIRFKLSGFTNIKDKFYRGLNTTLFNPKYDLLKSELVLKYAR